MLENYFITIVRSIIRNQFNIEINIAGLVWSMASCIFVYAFSRQEKSFDTELIRNAVSPKARKKGQSGSKFIKDSAQVVKLIIIPVANAFAL